MIANYKMTKNGLELAPNQSYNDMFSSFISAGEKVSIETAMTIPAFSACVQTIIESVGMLPLKLIHTYKDVSKTAYWKNEYTVLQDNANDYMTADLFRQNMTASYLLYGNAIAEKEYALDGSLIKLHYINPDRLENIYINKRNEIRYVIDGKEYGRNKIFHIAGLNYNNTGFKGTGILDNAKEILGIALAQMRYTSSYFKNGACPSTIILSKEQMTEDEKTNFLRRWNEKFQGSKNRYKTGILQNIVDIKTIGDDAEKAQLNESKKQTVIEICRLFRMPPHLVQSLDNATFSNIEEQGRQFILNTLMPHLIRWEKSCNSQLIKPEEKPFYQYKFNVDAIQRGKLLERYQAHQIGINAGFLTPNEVRELEERDQIEGGDKLRVLENYKEI